MNLELKLSDGMRILIVSDIHNDIENLMKFLDELKNVKFDVLVCPGDLTDTLTPKGFSKEEIGKLIIEEFKTLKKKILVVPGNQDKELIQLFEEEGISLHGKGKIIEDYGFYGFGGAKTPFGTSLEPTEEEIKNGLEKALNDVKKLKKKIQVTHVPPARTKIDKIFTGAHVGSETVRRFIEEKQPLLAISAHVHEARGVDEIGRTKIINSGRFPEGYYGLVEINDEIEKIEIINLI